VLHVFHSFFLFIFILSLRNSIEPNDYEVRQPLLKIVRIGAIPSNIYLFMSCLMTLSVAIPRTVKLIKYNLERIWKEAVVTNRSNIHAFAWRNWGKLRETWVIVANVSVEIRTKHPSTMCQEHYPFANAFGIFKEPISAFSKFLFIHFSWIYYLRIIEYTKPEQNKIGKRVKDFYVSFLCYLLQNWSCCI
jgi:hypothetical protein